MVLLEQLDDAVGNFGRIEPFVGIFIGEVGVAHGSISAGRDEGIDLPLRAFVCQRLSEVDDSSFGARVDGIVFAAARVGGGGDVDNVAAWFNPRMLAAEDGAFEIDGDQLVDFGWGVIVYLFHLELSNAINQAIDCAQLGKELLCG